MVKVLEPLRIDATTWSRSVPGKPNSALGRVTVTPHVSQLVRSGP